MLWRDERSPSVASKTVRLCTLSWFFGLPEAGIKSAQMGRVRRSVEKERRPPLRHQGIRSGGNLRVFENLAQTLVAVLCQNSALLK